MRAVKKAAMSRAFILRDASLRDATQDEVGEGTQSAPAKNAPFGVMQIILRYFVLRANFFESILSIINHMCSLEKRC
jgi:hypothetical protein